ncbi:MAG: LytTR family transcriptional regulator [Flavobacteriales bacterium]|nr:MAG: LytTR family transcriptional regulator [Flavobacteriales bacterium]
MKPSFPLLLRSSTGWVFITTVEILHIKAEDKYARLTCTDGSNLVLFHSLADLERRLACGKRIGELLFVRTHRSCIAAMHYAQAIPPKRGLLLADGTELPLGRGVRADLLRLMGAVHATARAVRAAVLLLVGNLLH